MTAHLPFASQAAALSRSATIATALSCGDGVGDITTRWFSTEEYPTAGNYALRVPQGREYVLTDAEKAALVYPHDIIVDASGGGDYTTVGAAIAAAGAEDRLLIKNGTYAPAYVSGSGYFVLSKQLTLEAYTGHSPVLTYGGTDEQSIVMVTAPGCVLRGLTLVGTYALGRPGGATIFGSCISTYAPIVIETCDISGFNHCGIKLFDGGGGTVIRRNKIYSGGYTTQDHAIYIATHIAGSKIVAGNHFHNITGYGIHAYYYEYDVTAYANLIHDNGGSGIYIHGERGKVYNNVCFNNNIGMDGAEMHNGIVKNNIFWGNTTNDVSLPGNKTWTSFTFTQNAFQTEYTDTFTNSEAGQTGVVRSDPQFVDSTPHSIDEFALGVSSPCRSTGTDLSSESVQGLDAAQTELTFKTITVWDMGAIAR